MVCSEFSIGGSGKTTIGERSEIECIVAGLACLYHLISTGTERIATNLEVRPDHLAAMWQADEVGLLKLIPRVPTLLLLQDLINRLVAHAPRALSDAQGHAAHLRWHWLRSYQRIFLAKGKHMRCQVDGVLVLRRVSQSGTSPFETQKDHYYTLLFLVDPGWQGPHDLRLIRTRLECLLRFRESEERWQHYSAFPPLLVMTQDRRNRDTWQWCAKEVSQRLRVAPLQGAVVAQPDCHGSAWSDPWQFLAMPGPCQLQTLLRPMTRAQILPEVLAPKSVPTGMMTRRKVTATSTDTTLRQLSKGLATSSGLRRMYPSAVWTAHAAHHEGHSRAYRN
ncbi:MAG: hypothetical protein J2P36_12895, partial [Ktedonobacteraceae bacterium]|nr:hypothetical protein [Ktedonobacteraceae bacterium]